MAVNITTITTAKNTGIQHFKLNFKQKPYNMKNIFVLDNGGETFDRYTIINEKDGEMIGASNNPFSPLGFGQHCGNVADNYWFVAYGYGWRRDCNTRLLNKRIKYAVEHFKANYGKIGKPIKFEELPPEVQKFATQSFN